MGGTEPSAGNPQTYANEIRPQLKIIENIAVRNAIDSGDRHRAVHNQSAKLPTFRVGDKVLLYDSTTETGENAKLKVRYKGPYLITDVCSGYNYRLQHCIIVSNI